MRWTLHLMNLIGVAMGAKRVVKIPYTRLEEEETLIENRTVFFANQLDFGVKLPWVWTVEIRNFTQIRQKILWYNSRIPALAINLQVDDDLLILVLSFSVYLIS